MLKSWASSISHKVSFSGVEEIELQNAMSKSIQKSKKVENPTKLIFFVSQKWNVQGKNKDEEKNKKTWVYPEIFGIN